MVLNCLSRGILGVAAPAIMAEQHISVLGSLVEQIGCPPFFILLGTVDLLGAALLWTLIRKPA